MATLAGDSRKLLSNSLIYLIPSLALRGLSVLMTPVYTRAMAPGDFAIVSIANTLTGVLGLLLAFSLQAPLSRFHFELDEPARRRLNGTITLFVLVVPTGLCVLLHFIGGAGSLDVFRTVTFHPHLELVIWTALFGIHANWPSAIYMAREQPVRVALFNTFSVVVQTVTTVLFVVVWHQGALGVLRANLVAHGAVAVVSLAAMSRVSAFSFDLTLLRRALTYALPLVPHLVANWALAVSDRLVLERYVSSEDLGCYSLAYLFNIGVAVFAAATASALGPMATRNLKEGDPEGRVPKLGTVTILAIVWFSLGTAVFASDAITLATPSAYHGARAYVPWVVLGAAFQGAYLVSSQGTWFSLKTRLVPLVTLVAGLTGIGLNVALAPRYGAMAAAVVTAVTCAMAFALHTKLADVLHPIAWPLRRWASMLAVAVVVYLVSLASERLAWPLALACKVVLSLGAFPALLVITRVVPLAQLRNARQLLRASSAGK